VTATSNDLWKTLQSIGDEMEARKKREREAEAAKATEAARKAPQTIARYLTVGGATVDIAHDTFYLYDTEPTASVASCGGCAANHSERWTVYAYRCNNGSSGADAEAGKWAQAHAEQCRAMPKPTA
jgi:hypothetical protein